MSGRSSVGRRWVLTKPRPAEEGRLAAELGISALLARLLVNRGFADTESASRFLSARLSEHLRSPMLFRDMGRATDRIRLALASGERIGIHGDYDADGISGSALLIRFFRELGSEPFVHVPHRLNEGYGLSELGIRRLAEAGARLVITVDCGGTSHREIAVARSLGVDVIVCDHHQVSGTPLGATAVLNPVEQDGGFPFRGLCGAGIAFYLAMGVRMRLRSLGVEPLPDLRRYLDLVTLGTIADLVPMVEENRVLVKYGLGEIARSQRPGLVALKAIGGVDEVTTGSVAFRLAPRLNAGGRLADASRSVELLTTDDRSVAEELALVLDAENQERQAIERAISADAIGRVEQMGGVGTRRSIVLGSTDWHPGVIGIVASRLVERYHRPTVLIALVAERGLGRGSGRSIAGVDLYQVLRGCGHLLEGFGGHPMAAGLTIRPERVEEFAQAVEAAVQSSTDPSHFVRTEQADCRFDLSGLDEHVLADISRLEPQGPGNRPPVFLGEGLSVLSSRVVGQSHLKLFLEQGGVKIQAIGFGMGELQVEAGQRIDILYRPTVNRWNGGASTELRLCDLRPHAASMATGVG